MVFTEIIYTRERIKADCEKLRSRAIGENHSSTKFVRVLCHSLLSAENNEIPRTEQIINLVKNQLCVTA